jgi:hypothetical protein
MKLEIEVRTTDVQDKKGISKKGAPYHIREQFGLVALPSGETRRVVISLEADDEPLAPGVYVPGPNAYYVDRFDSLAVSSRRRHLVRVADLKSVKAA